LLTKLFIVYGHKRLTAAQALNFNVNVGDGRIERVQLREQPIASLDKPPLAAQLVQALRAIAQPFVEPSLRIPQLPLDAAKLACQRRDLAIQ
jgi:hypothetical protein